MFIRNNKGFTLIELIMVIVILGILAAVVVPKFFDFTTDAHKSNVQAFIGTFKSSLELYSANSIVEDGYKSYPKGSDVNLANLLDQVPDEWTTETPSGNKITIKYTGDGKFTDGVKFEYNCSGNSGDSYTLKIKTSAYGWDVNDEF